MSQPLYLVDPARGKVFPVASTTQLRQLCEHARDEGLPKTVSEKATALLDPRGWHIALQVARVDRFYRATWAIQLLYSVRGYEIVLDMTAADFELLPQLAPDEMAARYRHEVQA